MPYDNRYLTPSSHKEDGNLLIGKLPKDVGADDLRKLGQPESPVKAIRAKCRDCCAGQDSEVRKCVAFDCPLWAFRMGSSPYRGGPKNPSFSAKNS